MRKELGAMILAGATVAGCGAKLSEEAVRERTCAPTKTPIETSDGEEICLAPGQTLVLSADSQSNFRQVITNLGDINGDQRVDFDEVTMEDIGELRLDHLSVGPFFSSFPDGKIIVGYYTAEKWNGISLTWNFAEVLGSHS